MDVRFHEVSTTPMSNTSRIVGGHETSIKEHPYQASMLFSFKDFTGYCSGFIINEDYVLTAAHCVYDATPSSTVLRVGSTLRDNGTIVPVAELTSHPDYNKIQYDSDVAVVRTEYPIVFSETVQPIRLPPLGRPVIADTCVVVAGWGKTVHGEQSFSTALREVKIPVVSNFKCFLSYFYTLTKNEFCAGNYYSGGMGACQGDSGSAAVQDGMAVGIVSYARGCAPPLSPNVFADIAAESIRTFIYNETGL
ncbi:hypothetical protein ABMA27_011699 [Loxostege sticticalis]|uniref:Peptidase S1 domain-containing protein n=1 Tax=Loxostege sticticalis TaxID=481309 RepID=A0ABR3IH65_LOXSC